MQDSVPASFSNVDVVTKANVYFDGKVVSHTVRLSDGSKKTVGLIYEGSFHFGTEAPERMQIVAGTCRARLDGESEWKTYGENSEFRVAGNSGFEIAVERGIVEYLCSFE
jgi:purine/pyrimidine-nucleoside phosphorylase